MQKKKLQQQEKNFDELNSNLSENEKNVEDYKSEMIEQIRISTEAKGDMSQKTVFYWNSLSKRKNSFLPEKEYLKDQIHTHQIHNEVLSKQKRDF